MIVKPNVYSWRNSTVANMFKTAYNYNCEMDSHMMKNTEWGAVAYLSHSKYGINTEININNNSDYLTGYSSAEGTDQSNFPGTYGIDESVTLPYNTPTGCKASTTGNITGIYDMSGGANEYMSSYISGYGANASGLTISNLTKYDTYFDIYPNTSVEKSWNNRILGDATGEMGPFYHYANKDNQQRLQNNWYSNGSIFVYSDNPWFHRGGSYLHGSLAGQFHFGRDNGSATNSFTFRLILL